MTRPPYARTHHANRSPGQTAEERLFRIEEWARRLAGVAEAARKARAELDEASSWGAAGGGSVTPGRTVTKESDPTGTVAVSVTHATMRLKLQPLTEMLLAIDTKPLEKALGEVEKLAADTLRLAWDPELRAMLKRADEADRDYRNRKRTRSA
jgi:hypothetical protein